MVKLRPTIAVELFSGFRVFGGAALNFYFSSNNTGEDLIRWSVYDAVIGNGSTAYRVSPGLVFGVQLF
jgi:hypothetical protein